MPDLAELLEVVRRVERKLDTLIAALAAEDEDDGTVKSLDGRTFAPRDDSKGLG